MDSTWGRKNLDTTECLHQSLLVIHASLWWGRWTDTQAPFCTSSLGCAQPHSFSCCFQAVGFLGGSVVKNPPAKAGDEGLVSGWGRSHGEGNDNPLQYSSCLESPMDREAWPATVHGVAQSVTTEHTHIPSRLLVFSPADLTEFLFSANMFSFLEIPFGSL